ncbi:MAG: hypothetical protein R3F04_05775 [Lysobacteraceae bacterium]
MQLNPAELQADLAFSAGFRIEPDSGSLQLDVLTGQEPVGLEESKRKVGWARPVFIGFAGQ